jgi:hypothetical protein
MSADGNDVLMAAVLDALTMVQGQLDTIAKSNARIEASQKDILHRLDTIDAGQAGVTDLVPVLETILARLIEDRDLNRAGFAKTAEVSAFAYAAAMGNRMPLPVEVVDDPLLERFTLLQPADHVTESRALVEWRGAIRKCGTAELIDLLRRQYEPSPTDTPEARVLRYQLAALTRSEIEGRGGAAPTLPASTIAHDRSVQARKARSEDLAALWRAGPSAALFSEAELAPTLELFANAERAREGVIGEAQLTAELAALHGKLGDRIEAGERPSLSTGLEADAGARSPAIEADKHR